MSRRRMMMAKKKLVNLFDFLNPYFVSGYITIDRYRIAPSEKTVTFYIPCEPETNYTIYRKNVKTANQVWRVGTVTDEPYTEISVNDIVGGISEELLLHIKTGLNSQYLVFCEGNTLNTDDLSKFVIVKGKYNENYFR